MILKDDGSAATSYGRAFFWFAVTIAVTVVLVLILEDVDKKDQEPHPSASVVASLSDKDGKGTQNGVVLPQNCQIEGKIPYGCLDTLTTEERDAITCANEDGTGTKGQACIWMDPDTRDLYYVISD